jgi:hypothetical protein
MNHSQNYYQNCLAGRAKAGGSQVQSQPGLKTKTLPHKKKKEKEKDCFGVLLIYLLLFRLILNFWAQAILLFQPPE